MLQVDFHAHSLFSYCGCHTVIEMLTHAGKLGLSALAITDHCGEMFGRVPGPFFDRLENPVDGIRLLKGVECNVLNDKGDVDFPLRFIRRIDVALVGIHPNVRSGLGTDAYTAMLVEALANHPYLDIVTHPNDATYPVDFGRLSRFAARNGFVLELNNAKTMLHRIDDTVTAALVAASRDAGCRIAVNSDAHALREIGRDEAIRPFLAGFPEELIVNRDAESALAFVDERRKIREAWAGDVSRRTGGKTPE